jgi:vesicle coat complex subunit
LISTKINYVTQEVIVVVKDILRRYPNRFEGIIPALCENLENLTDSDAKAAVIWIVGEYAERIVNMVSILETFLDNFKDEQVEVQFQILTAIVKAFLKRPSSTQELIQKVLQLATTSTQSSDLRDRAYIYWRLLSSDPKTAKVNRSFIIDSV